MKIAFLGTRGIPGRYSGIEASIEEISTRLADKGHQVVVYCRKPKYAIYPGYLSRNIKLLYIPTVNNKHFGTFIHVFLSTLHLLFSDVDIVHFNALGASFFSFLPRLFFKKTIVTIHGLDWKRKKWKYFARSFLKLCEYPAVYFPNKTVAVSKTVKDYFEAKFKKKVYYIPNGINIFEDIEQSRNFEKSRNILFVGRLVPEKGIHYLIKAYNEIKTDIKLLIGGEPSFTDRYAAYLRSIANKNTEFLGFVQADTLRQLYLDAYLFVLPSEVEGLSVSLLEAMSYSNCVLASDIPENAEVIGDCGFYFRSGDYLDLKDKLQYLINNPQVVSLAGAKARKRVIGQYHWDSIIQELEKVYCQ